MDENLNTGYYKDFDTNFEQAYSLLAKSFSHEELLKFLREGNIPEKQLAALMFDRVNNEEDARALIDNLTGCDGKIREAVALKIYQLLNSNDESGRFFIYPEIFAQATIDINANICRLIVDSAKFLKGYEDFAINYTGEIIKITNSALEELDKFIFRDKKYVINKQLFKLYWCLETLKSFYEFVDKEELSIILEKCAQNSEYTIREKTAQLVREIGSFSELEGQLKSDENYYVREVFSR